MNRNVLHAIFWLVVISTGCEGPMGPPGPGFGSLDDPSVMPAVVYTYPPMNSTGPYPDFYVNDCGSGICSYYSMIQVRFNKFMDVTSVRRAVRISSSAGGVTTDTNHVASFGGDVVMVTPVDSNGSRMDVRYLLGETYRLSIDSTARDINGNSLRVPFLTTFVPEPCFRVRGFW
ncbi:MAG TPA: Ig-like domain-containing protein, partial [Bacteroidota bacterium]|nr:Ig-like domain-containing protein [Bacteroidota bacterium]